MVFRLFNNLMMVAMVINPLSCSAQPVIDPNTIVEFINGVRTSVTAASNIRQLKWNEELASFAQSHADGCSLTENPHKVTDSYTLIGENHNVSIGVANPETYVQDVLEAWVQSGDYYNYERNVCTDNVDCSTYTQLVWSETFLVGCGSNICDPGDQYFFVCNFYPGGNRFGTTAYTEGEQCSGCGTLGCSVDSYSLCIPDDSPDMMTGSDPHFSVRLPSGQLLCFTVQGELWNSFNLISTNELEMNAQFIYLPSRPRNTWLGAIGITVTGKQLVFNSTAGTIGIDNKMKLASASVKKIRVANNRFYLTMSKEEMGTDRVEVEIQELDVHFSVVFVGEHLDMIWNSGEMDKENIHGLLGQFLRPGVALDEEGRLLILPGKPSVPIEQQQLYRFIRADAPQYNHGTCWTAVKHSNQGVGVIEGTYTDYEVNNLLHTGFRFGVDNRKKL